MLTKTGYTGDGRIILHILHDIGRGSYTDSDNYNKTKTPGALAQLSKFIYYPLVKLEISYWEHSQPDIIYTEWCSE